MNTRNICGMLLCCWEKANKVCNGNKFVVLWFCYSYVLNYFYCDWTLQNQHSNNQQFSGGYSFDLMRKEK